MEPLKQMAQLAAQQRIRGRSNERNSLLKPLDIILENLEREPKEEMWDAVRSASAQQIFDHLHRIASNEYKPGKRKRSYIRQYVNIFFDDLLIAFHRRDVNRLLQRTRLLRSAYLFYYADESDVIQGSQTK